LLVVLLVPEHATQEHLEILSELAQMLSEPSMRDQLQTSLQPAALLAIVAAWEPIRPAA
jgi:PTS system nitrogen regulatory IIA component